MFLMMLSQCSQVLSVAAPKMAAEEQHEGLAARMLFGLLGPEWLHNLQNSKVAVHISVADNRYCLTNIFFGPILLGAVNVASRGTPTWSSGTSDEETNCRPGGTLFYCGVRGFKNQEIYVVRGLFRDIRNPNPYRLEPSHSLAPCLRWPSFSWVSGWIQFWPLPEP